MRGVPILRTWGLTMPTHVLAERSEGAVRSLRSQGCTAWPEADAQDRLDGGEGLSESWTCDSTSDSRAVLVHGCAGTEAAGCCRVMTWLGSVVLTPKGLGAKRFEWLLIVDDDIFIRPDLQCVLRPLDPSEPLFLPAKHVHNASLTEACLSGASTRLSDCNRMSLCATRQPVHRRPTQLPLAAGYGILSVGFARRLGRGWASQRLKAQCVATQWNNDLALSFASWALSVPLVPALDWTHRPVVAWAGGQHRLWSAGSVINHKTDTEYDYVELLDACAFGADVHQPVMADLRPFINERVAQSQYPAIVARARATGEAIPDVADTSGALWRCAWVKDGAIEHRAGRRNDRLDRRTDGRMALSKRRANPFPVPSPVRESAAAAGSPQTSFRVIGSRTDAAWELKLEKHFDPACVDAHGVDLPCDPPLSPSDLSSMRIHGSCVRLGADARRVCAKHPHCVGLMFSTDGRVATLKFRHLWMDSTAAKARGWHVPSSVVASTSPSIGSVPPLPASDDKTETRLKDCIDTTAALAGHAAKSHRCDAEKSRRWVALQCSTFVTNGRYGGSAMHTPPSTCTPTWPRPLGQACLASQELPAVHPRGSKASRSSSPSTPAAVAGCLVVLLRGHAFRLGGQFTQGADTSLAMVTSQARVLQTVRDQVLVPSERTSPPWRLPLILIDAVRPAPLDGTWRKMCAEAFAGWQTVIRPLGNRSGMLYHARGGSQRLSPHHGRTSQAASLRMALQWVTETLQRIEHERRVSSESRGGSGGSRGGCWDAMLVLRTDIAFKATLPIPPPWSDHAAAFHVPHPAPSCGGLTQTPNGNKRVGDSFFYVPRDLHERLAYAMEAKDELYLKAIALHDLADWLPTDRLRYWMRGEYESNTAIAANPLFFQTGRDAATKRSRPCAARPDSVLWAENGSAVWALETTAEGQEGPALVGSFPYVGLGVAPG